MLPPAPHLLPHAPILSPCPHNTHQVPHPVPDVVTWLTPGGPSSLIPLAPPPQSQGLKHLHHVQFTTKNPTGTLSLEPFSSSKPAACTGHRCPQLFSDARFAKHLAETSQLERCLSVPFTSPSLSLCTRYMQMYVLDTRMEPARRVPSQRPGGRRGFGVLPPPFDMACGPSAQHQGLLAEGQRTSGSHKQFSMMS